MGIDGIGGPRPPLGPLGGAGEGSPLGGASALEGSRPVEGAQAADAAGRPEEVTDVDRARLERGELSVDEYLEIQVQQATSHLVDRVPPAALDLVRAELRSQLAADPVLRSLTAQISSAGR